MSDVHLLQVAHRLSKTLALDDFVQKTTDELRRSFQVDRVVLYYFYSQWKGQVTFESLSLKEFSILGSTGPDECFNSEYAALYLAGRVRAIADIEKEPIHPCHRDFLRSLGVRANLVAPILNKRGLWGLLIAHNCLAPRYWLPFEIETIKRYGEILAKAASIRDS